MTKPVLIGLSGSAGSGKSTAAHYLVEKHAFMRVRFAGPLKAMTRAYLQSVAAYEDDIHRMIDGDLKEVPSDLMGGRTPRYWMQRLGTEFGRDLIAPDLWTSAFKLAASAYVSRGSSVVVDDVRFENEVEALHRLGGSVVKIVRLCVGSHDSGHSSEAGVPADMVLINNGEIGALYLQLDNLVRFVRLPKPMDSAA
jgi:hypothetical protein